MRVSDKGLEFISTWEGCVLSEYEDVAGYSTIGVGHLITDREKEVGLIYGLFDWSDGISYNDALRILARDVTASAKGVDYYTKVPLLQHQFDALVSFTFNVGIGAYSRSTLLRKLNQHLYAQVPTQLKRWNRAGGRVIRGLVRRRDAEAKLFRMVS